MNSFLKKNFHLLKDDPLVNSDSSVLLKNFKIKIDPEDDFQPFEIEFTEFGKDFKEKFVKSPNLINKRQKRTESSQIYVIDEETKNPVVFNNEYHQVCES